MMVKRLYKRETKQTEKLGAKDRWKFGKGKYIKETGVWIPIGVGQQVLVLNRDHALKVLLEEYRRNLKSQGIIAGAMSRAVEDEGVWDELARIRIMEAI